MKPYLFFIFFIIAFSAAYAQDNNDEKDKMNAAKDHVILKDNYAFNVPHAKFLFETEKGRVYQLPLDNMRCLVPAINSHMPVYNLLPGESPKTVPVPIPNPLAGKDMKKIPGLKRPPLPGK